MNKNIKFLPEITLCGISTRTNNKNEMGDEAKIPFAINKYFASGIISEINNKVDPGKTYCVYTDYESDHTGEYTFFIGTEVNEVSSENHQLENLTIRPQKYRVLTTDPGSIPRIIIDMWKKIWGMTSEDFGGDRAYIADFEIYDERSKDHSNSIVDIYIGIK
jgi:predicted transcriptional regulator YdeE